MLENLIHACIYYIHRIIIPNKKGNFINPIRVKSYFDINIIYIRKTIRLGVWILAIFTFQACCVLWSNCPPFIMLTGRPKLS